MKKPVISKEEKVEERVIILTEEDARKKYDMVSKASANALLTNFLKCMEPDEEEEHNGL